jgi:Zn-dependent protease with chaperone function
MAGSPPADRARPGAWRRALTALALWAGFYTLAVGLVVALLSLPYAQVRVEGSIGFAGIACGLAALTLVWALFPRFRRFEPPGEALDHTAYPRVTALVSEIAGRVGHRAPQDLFLSHDANAFATRYQRKWYGRRRSAVGIGLVMFEILDRDELASVVAHELGHHVAGDVALGPWIHRIRRAIAGTLERIEGSNFWLHLPFVAYGALFLRITRRSSREQELAADALAARTCGAAATGAALERVNRLGALWDLYWDTEVEPLLNRGFVPPLLDGFRAMLAAPAIAETARKKQEPRAPTADDTHPLLADRLAALGVDPEALNPEPPAQGARTWFDGPAAERVVVRSVLRNPDLPLKPVTWQEVGERVWIPHWREMLVDLAQTLQGVTLQRLPEYTATPALLGRLPGGLAILSPQAEEKRTRRILGAWLAVELHRRGFTARAEPCVPVRLEREGLAIEPDVVVAELTDGTLSAHVWRTRCDAIDRA